MKHISQFKSKNQPDKAIKKRLLWLAGLVRKKSPLTICQSNLKGALADVVFTITTTTPLL
jgi:hypothetical protein